MNLLVFIFIIMLSYVECYLILEKRNDLRCNAINTLVKISKEEFDEVSQSIIRICNGEIIFKKCEGKCASSLQPSFNSPNGFFKNCFCCKETELHSRKYILPDCFDVNGKRLFGHLAEMKISLQEPVSCECSPC